MALRERKQVKAYTIDEMMYLINYKYITKGINSPSYVIANTSYYIDSLKSIIICDARYECEDFEESELMGHYYGATIEDAVTNCFNDRHNHEIYDKNASLDG